MLPEGSKLQGVSSLRLSVCPVCPAFNLLIWGKLWRTGMGWGWGLCVFLVFGCGPSQDVNGPWVDPRDKEESSLLFPGLLLSFQLSDRNSDLNGSALLTIEKQAL